MTKISPKAVIVSISAFSPICFLATATLQQFEIENFLVQLLQLFNFAKKDIPFLMAGTMFIWAYVITASLSVWAQALGSKHGYVNNEPRIYRNAIKGTFGRMIASHQVALENVPAVHIMALSCTVWLFSFALIPGFEDYYSHVTDVLSLLKGVSDDVKYI
ncbi:4587_t:CDS:2 [Entrophospora sp. SA101]|nr:14704_t:CDS:2 [Entrophospora sp. SA101]CAJ0642568.1 4587_t:CDS:2 [Entrophospora sp. SA101]